MYIIGFNGPPRSGKDTVANMLRDHLCLKSNLPTNMIPLSMPMRRMAMGAIGMEYSTQRYEQLKDQPIAALGGKTLRQFMIEISERYMKQVYGPDIWNGLLNESIPLGYSGIILIPDFGFQHEPEYFERAFGAKNVLTVQIERPGKTFEGDSRNWVRGTQTYRFANDSDLDDLHTIAVRIYGRLVNQLGWRL